MAQQLPRCGQLVSWKRVSRAWGKVGGMSMRGVHALTSLRPAVTSNGSGVLRPHSQCLLNFRRPRAIVRVFRSDLPSICCERLRLHRSPGLRNAAGDRFVSGNLTSPILPSLSNFLVRGLSSAEASALADGFLKESLSKDEEEKSVASLPAVEQDTGELLLREVEEQPGTSLPVVALDTETLLVTEIEEKSLSAGALDAEALLLTEVEEQPSPVTKKEVEKDVLLAQIKSKEIELEELRRSLRLIEDIQTVAELPKNNSSSPMPLDVSAVEDVKQVAFPQESVSDLSNTGSQSVSVSGKELSSIISLSDDSDDSSDDSDEESDITLDEFNAVFSKMDEDLGLSTNASVVEITTNGSVDPKSSIQVTTNSLMDTNSSVQLTTDASVDAKSSEHPWPEWIQFLKQLEKGGYFANEDGKVADIYGSSHESIGFIKRACLDFARERDDIFLNFSRKDMEVMARFGCPSTDRKLVNAGKRLRDHLAIDEKSVCKPCALRSSCERADFKASSDHLAGTPEVIRLLSQYALQAAPGSNGLKLPETVEKSCVNLLKEAMALGAIPRDPKLPKLEKKSESVKADKSEKRERESKRRGEEDVEMKPGDWKCSECQYVNFARNRTCRECDAFRPTDLRPGDWRCPECHFVNFSRNVACHDCKAEKPRGAGDDSFDRGNRHGRGTSQDRGSRFDRGSGNGSLDRGNRFDKGTSRGSSQDRRSDVRSYDRDSRERGSDRIGSRGGERERGGLERRSGRGDTGGRRSYEEWNPDFSKKGRGTFDDDDDDDEDTRLALNILNSEDDDDDDDDFESKDEDSDVDESDDDEFEHRRPGASASRGRTGAGRGRGGLRSSGLSFDSWDKPRNERRSSDSWDRDDRPFRGERGGRGAGRGGRGGFDRGTTRSSSRESKPSSYERSDRDSRRSYGSSDRDSGRSYGSSDRDSRRSSGRSDRDSDRPSRGRGGGRGRGRAR